MEGEMERALGQPTSGSNWTAVTKFMLSAGMEGSSEQKLGLTCSLILINFHLSLIFSQIVFSVYKFKRSLAFLKSLLKREFCEYENAVKMGRQRVIVHIHACLLSLFDVSPFLILG